METVALSLGSVASGLLIWMAFTTDQRRMIWLSVALGITASLQYALLGQLGAGAMGALGLARSLVLIGSGRWPWLAHRAIPIVLLALHPIVYGFTESFTDPVAMLSLVAAVVGVIALGFKSFFKMKVWFAASIILWLTFQIVVGAWGQVPGEIVSLIASLYAIHRIIKTRKAENQSASATEVVKNEETPLSEKALATV